MSGFTIPLRSFTLGRARAPYSAPGPSSFRGLRSATQRRSTHSSHPPGTEVPDEAFVNVLLRASRSYRPLLFAVGVSVGFYAYAADQTNKDTIKWSKRVRGALNWEMFPPNTQELTHAKTLGKRDALIGGLNALKRQTETWSKSVSIQLQRVYVILANSYLSLPEATRICYTITAINSMVFVAWKVPRLQGVMMRHFIHDPLSGRSHTLLTSMFSHQTFWHLLFNSMALNSFGAAFDVVDSQRPEVIHQAHSTNKWHFLGFYLGAGLFASTLSHMISTRVILPRILRTLADPTKAASITPGHASIHPSLGASGAIYGVVAMTAVAMPETNISLIFLPMVPFPITYGFAAMVGLDILGVIRGWKMFDHWAHLGGAAAGLSYFYYGPWEYVRAKLWPLRA